MENPYVNLLTSLDFLFICIRIKLPSNRYKNLEAGWKNRLYSVPTQEQEKYPFQNENTLTQCCMSCPTFHSIQAYSESQPAFIILPQAIKTHIFLCRSRALWRKANEEGKK